MTRHACAKINVIVKKHIDDNYTSVDFRINNIIKIQDKCTILKFTIRKIRCLPYNPDTFDILQVSNLEAQEVYAIPMRYIENDIVKSTFNEDTLMKQVIGISNKWTIQNKKYKFDLKTIDGILQYVKHCENAASIPPLTDREFWNNMQCVKDNIQKGIFFIMREDVFPCWDDPNNITGGCLSIKILKDNLPAFWEDLSIKMLGETLLKDNKKEHWNLVNGISTSPKKHFCIIKIGLKNNTLCSKDFFNLPSNYYGDILYKSNMENIKGDHSAV
jgi:hypothetical protein